MISDVTAGAGLFRVDTGDPDVGAFLMANGFEVAPRLRVDGARRDDVAG